MSAVSPEASVASRPAGGSRALTPPTNSGLPLSRALWAKPRAARLSSSGFLVHRDHAGSIASSNLEFVMPSGDYPGTHIFDRVSIFL